MSIHLTEVDEKFKTDEYENDYEYLFHFEFRDATYLIGVNPEETTTLDFTGTNWRDYANTEAELDTIGDEFTDAMSTALEEVQHDII